MSNGSIRYIERVVAVLCAGFACCSCATIISGIHQEVTFDSSPPGATVHVEGYPEVTTPATLKLWRKYGHTAVIKKDGYRDEVVPIKVDLNYFSFLDILTFPVGVIVDAMDGAMGELVPSNVSVTLQPAAP